jgi:hypothetical protein
MPADETIIIHGQRHTIEQCGTCGVYYTVPEFVNQNHRRLGGYSFCPNGHQWGWRSGTERAEQEAIRQERDRLKQDAARLEEEIAAEKQRTKDAEKKYLQARRRAVAGVCPCCNRTFQNMQKHMLTKHPNVTPLSQKEKARDAP